jgi:hypothetical protein
MLNKDAIKERENLRPFGQRATCFNYDVHDKLSPRSYEALVVGYTNTYDTYWIIDSFGKQRLTKNPKPIKVEDESDGGSITGESQSDIYNETLAFEQAVTPEPATVPKQIIELGSRIKAQWKSAAEYTALYGSRNLKRTRHLSQKAKEAAGSIRTVGINVDHLTDEQARAPYNSLEWAKARTKEREQLQQYGVYTIVDQLPKGVKPVDTKWVYIIKRKPDRSIEKYKARKVGRGFIQEDGVNDDSDKTFSQMMRLESWRMILVAALAKDWKVRQWVVVAAYLQEKLRHDIYVVDIKENRETEYWKLH